MAEPSALLSRMLLRYIEELDDTSEDAPVEADYEEVQRLTRLMASALLNSRLSPTSLVAVRKIEVMLRDQHLLLEHLFDDDYSRRLVKMVPKLVRRTMKLSSLVVKDTPSPDVNVYIGEAGRNYVFGFWISCIALCRTALETSLREFIRSQRIATLPSRELQELIKTASVLKLLDRPTEHLARIVQRSGNSIIHPTSTTKPPKEKDALEALGALRGVLWHLYKEMS
jgi:hypothetical protein